MFCFTLLAGMAIPYPASAQTVSEMAARLDTMSRQMQAMQQELVTLRRQAGTQRQALVGEVRERRTLSREQSRIAERQTRQQQVAQAGGPGGARPSANEHTPVILADDLVCNAGSYTFGWAIGLTPGGIVELAGFYRSANTGSDVATDFNGIPFRNSPQSRESEFHLSARQSRLSGPFTGARQPIDRFSANSGAVCFEPS